MLSSNTPRISMRHLPTIRGNRKCAPIFTVGSFGESAHWYPSCYVYLVENFVKPFMKVETDRAAIEREAPNWRKLAGILEQRLTNQRWLCGENVTLADIAVAAPIHLHPYQKLPLDSYQTCDVG